MIENWKQGGNRCKQRKNGPLPWIPWDMDDGIIIPGGTAAPTTKSLYSLSCSKMLVIGRASVGIQRKTPVGERPENHHPGPFQAFQRKTKSEQEIRTQ
jgi:hypothetical protein